MQQEMGLFIIKFMKQNVSIMRPLQSQDPNFIVYIIENAKIGFGVYGDCFLGYYQSDNEIIVLKKVYRKRKSYHQFEKDYKKQVDNLSKAAYATNNQQNSNVVNVYPAYLISNKKTHAYIMMEYCKGGSLSDLMQYRRMKGYWFSFGEFCSMFRDLVNGLVQVITANILHQDMKPQNIFISDGTLKIGDFGLSHDLERIGIQNSGTQAYNAPEKYTSTYKFDFSADIYAMGVIIYQLIFNKHPYYSQQEKKTYYENFLKQNQVSFKRIVNGELYNKMNEESQKAELFYQFIKSRKLNSKHTYQITVNYEQRKCLEDIISVVIRMLSFEISQRPSHVELKKFVETQPLKCEKLQFIEKTLPIKFKKDIQKFSGISVQKVPRIKYHQQFRDTNEFTELSNLCDFIEVTNMLTNLIFSITETLHKQVSQDRAYWSCLSLMLPALKSFNYCLTYNKYVHILSELEKMQQEQRRLFYQLGLNYLVNNTEHNKNFLENEICCYLNLRKITVSQAYGQMDSFIQDHFVVGDSSSSKPILVDNSNKLGFLMVVLVLRVVKAGQDIAREDISEIKHRENEFISNKNTLSVGDVDGMLRIYGIRTGMIECED